MKEEGNGANYAYDHDEPDGFSGQNYWPKALGRQTLYRPVVRGFERDLLARLDHWAKLRKQRHDPD
jgi:putative ATPase